MKNPTHRHIETGSLVFPEGYEPQELEALPADFWQEIDIFALVAEIKSEAARRIDKISPLWRQHNDLREPSAAGAARFAAIDSVRAWSNGLEADARKTRTAAALRKIRAKMQET